MISIGIGAGMSGLIIAQLKDASNDVKMTLDEESWFGNDNKIDCLFFTI